MSFRERIDALMDKVEPKSGEPLKVLFMAGCRRWHLCSLAKQFRDEQLYALNALNAEKFSRQGRQRLTLENLLSP